MDTANLDDLNQAENGHQHGPECADTMECREAYRSDRLQVLLQGTHDQRHHANGAIAPEVEQESSQGDLEAEDGGPGRPAESDPTLGANGSEHPSSTTTCLECGTPVWWIPTRLRPKGSWRHLEPRDANGRWTDGHHARVPNQASSDPDEEVCNCGTDSRPERTLGILINRCRVCHLPIWGREWFDGTRKALAQSASEPPDARNAPRTAPEMEPGDLVGGSAPPPPGAPDTVDVRLDRSDAATIADDPWRLTYYHELRRRVGAACAASLIGCSPACSEGHTYQAPCEQATDHSVCGEHDATGTLTCRRTPQHDGRHLAFETGDWFPDPPLEPEHDTDCPVDPILDVPCTCRNPRHPAPDPDDVTEDIIDCVRACSTSDQDAISICVESIYTRFAQAAAPCDITEGRGHFGWCTTHDRRSDGCEPPPATEDLITIVNPIPPMLPDRRSEIESDLHRWRAYPGGNAACDAIVELLTELDRVTGEHDALSYSLWMAHEQLADARQTIDDRYTRDDIAAAIAYGTAGRGLPGGTYFQRHDEIHSTRYADGTVTLNRRWRGDRGDNATTFWALDQDWVSADPVDRAREALLLAIHDALVILEPS